MVLIYGGNKFEILKEELDDIKINTYDINTYILIIKRINRFFKDQIRCVRLKILFKYLLYWFTIKMIW